MNRWPPRNGADPGTCQDYSSKPVARWDGAIGLGRPDSRQRISHTETLYVEGFSAVKELTQSPGLSPTGTRRPVAGAS